MCFEEDKSRGRRRRRKEGRDGGKEGRYEEVGKVAGERQACRKGGKGKRREGGKGGKVICSGG